MNDKSFDKTLQQLVCWVVLVRATMFAPYNKWSKREGMISERSEHYIVGRDVNCGGKIFRIVHYGVE